MAAGGASNFVTLASLLAVMGTGAGGMVFSYATLGKVLNMMSI